LVKNGLSGRQHPAEVGAAEAALISAARLAHERGEIPACRASQVIELGELPVPADAAVDLDRWTAGRLYGGGRIRHPGHRFAGPLRSSLSQIPTVAPVTRAMADCMAES
jgi:hypothetical protein